MKHLKEISNCPLCDSSEKEVSIETKDYMITQESFSICSCKKCGFWFTSPIPQESEIGTYYKHEAYVSHSSSKKGLINFLYNVVRKKTLQQKTNLIQSYIGNGNLLDYGCGTGHFLAACKNRGIKVIGMEPDSDARKFAVEELGLRVQATDTLDEIQNGSLDAISMWHVLEHVYHLNRDVSNLLQKLKKGAIFLVAVPNRNSYDAKRYEGYWAAYDLPRHLYHFTQKDIEVFATKHGLQLEKVLPMKFDSYYVSMLSEKYKSGSLFSALKTGFLSNQKAKKGGGYSSQIYILKKM